MKKDTKSSSPHRVAKIFNYIGGTLIFFGIVYFISNNWRILTSFLKIFTTLGVAIAAYSTACLLTLEKRHLAASTVFFMLAGLFFPLGLSITLDEFGLSTNFEIADIVISGICFSIFLTGTLYFHRTVLLFFSIIFGTMFFIAVTNYVAHQIYESSNTHLLDYQFLLIGLYYVALGYYFTANKPSALVGPLNFFGGYFVLMASFSLAGLLFDSESNFFWEMLTPLLIMASFLLAVPLRSKAMLYLGAGALIVYIPCITHKYAYLFGNFGWPMILISAGLALMALGYLVVYIQKNIPTD
jgi:hypothetical protein